MKSPPRSSFAPPTQVTSIDSRIVAALERLSEAFRVLLWRTGKEHKLSPIAIQILLFLRHHKVELATVGYIAQEFNMTKQTVSEAVATLEAKGLIQKTLNVLDARSTALHLTEHGTSLAEQISNFATPLEEALALLTQETKAVLFDGLLNMIHTLHNQGIVTTQRMCFTCRFYAANNAGHEHYCQLLQQPLSASNHLQNNVVALRIDCEEHQLA